MIDTLELKHPITIGEGTHNTLEFKKHITAKQLRDIGIPDTTNPFGTDTFAYLKAMTGEPSAILEQLHAQDYIAACHKVFQYFDNMGDTPDPK